MQLIIGNKEWDNWNKKGRDLRTPYNITSSTLVYMLSFLLGSAGANLPFPSLAFIRAIARWQAGRLILVQNILLDVVYDGIRQQVSNWKASSQEEANLEE